MNKGFEPSLFDKLFDELPLGAQRRRLSLDELKEAVARDLEALLNTRVVFALPAAAATDFPLARRSVAGFGLADFAGLSLASVHDRQRICDDIAQAIATHEPRLREVRVALTLERRSINALYFSIHAVLLVSPAQEAVAFDALLEPSTLQYAISRRKGRPGGAP